MVGLCRIAGLLVLMLAACSDPAPFAVAVFVGADYETVNCDGGDTCVRVFSEVDGSDVGRGSCILYAPTSRGLQVAVAASGELELKPGESVQWIVPVPSHFNAWNPVCTPTAEG